jgi:hypothetical protein
VSGNIKFIWDQTPEKNRPSVICVDSIGIGAGVADRLREMGLPVRDINVSEAPSIKGVYMNQRTELWFTMREWFESRAVNISKDKRLLGDLIRPRFKFHSTGKKVIETKDDLKKRSKDKRSTDYADALMMTFAGTAVQAKDGTHNSYSWNQPLPWKQPYAMR